jgi:hypothetical protein
MSKVGKGSGGGDIEETFTYHVRGSGERRPESAQKIRECAVPLSHLAARRHKPARWSPTRSCTSSVRVNTRGLPGDRHKGKNAEMRGRSWPLRGPLTPGDAFDAGLWTHVAGSGPLPWLLPTTPVDSYPRQLWPGWHTKQQHFAQRPDMVGQPRRHGGRTGPPLLRGAAAVGGLGLRQRQA